MLEGKRSILEIGCGDGFGIPIIAQGKGLVCGIDIDDKLIKGNRKRLKKIKNIKFKNVDICKFCSLGEYDAIFSIDVIEHLGKKLDKPFMEHTCLSLKNDGVCIIGTPNKTASKYATHRSAVQHINLKTQKTLRELMEKYFKNVVIFSMNDEVIHTGYAPMSHYIFGVGVGKK